MKRYRTPLAVITRDHAPSGRTVPPDHETIKTAFVNRYGDPLGLKSNTWVSILAPLTAQQANFELRANCNVTHLEGAGGRVTKVHYRDPMGGRARRRGGHGGRRLLGDRERAAAAALGGSRPGRVRRAHPRQRPARALLPHALLRRGLGDPARARRQVPDAGLRLGHRPLRARRLGAATNGLWAGGAIYNNTSDAGAADLAGAHLAGAGHGHHLEGLPRRHVDRRRRLRGLPGPELRPPACR